MLAAVSSVKAASFQVLVMTISESSKPTKHHALLLDLQEMLSSPTNLMGRPLKGLFGNCMYRTGGYDFLEVAMDDAVDNNRRRAPLRLFF
jgi:hypothetical protein